MTSILFQNDGYRLQDPDPVVRTQVSAPEHGIDFDVVLNDPDRVSSASDAPLNRLAPRMQS